ncbi:Ppx/GppA phosphatase family protein [Desulfosporosinus shakirovi]|uniref:Ppx/GppA phosphatase family protein n=1 Tax=Desulfosporosinus shakirovi TaxID=2885154 RepID=UPI001E43366D|nr:HD domain-containing protein [Desulfosporosinus sp. SRJS8]MCB8814895.1 HD domain-containing protein [Desulfosporosinus sp. SRJS8]
MKKKNEVVAAINVGSDFLRMSIAQLHSDGTLRILEDTSLPNNIGKDTFTTRRISPKTINETCVRLKSFAKLMKDYRVKVYRAIATSGLHEADNRDYIIEQIRLIAGIHVEIVNNVQERFLIYKALRNYLNEVDHIDLADSIIANITSGGVEVSMYATEGLKFTEHLKIGPLRLREVLSSLEAKTISFPRIMEEYIESKIYLLKPKLKKMPIKKFICLGGSLSTLLEISKLEHQAYISKESFDTLYFQVRDMSRDQMIEAFNITSAEAELLLPTILIIHSLLSRTKSNGIHAPMITNRQGILYELIDNLYEMPRKSSDENDIISSVWYMAEKYGVDEKHAAYVEKISLELFGKTWKYHKLGDQEKLYLQVAAILHDSGNYVSLSEHSNHSSDIIRSQSILGFSDKELELIANIAKYHTRRIPTYSDRSYYVLSHTEKILVSKLSSILKIAESMDISHKQKISDFEILSSSDDELHLHLISNKDIILEKWDIMNNAEFFQEVMGVRIKLKG